MLVVYWKSGESEGFGDLLPSRWFDEEGDWPLVTHEVQSPKGGRSTARCSLSVRGNIVDLDYGGQHTSYNEGRFYTGTIRLIFSGRSRKSVKEVQWRDDDRGATFEVVDVECYELSVPFEGLGDFDPLNTKDGRKKIEQMVALRQGQPSFRKALMDAYERRCAITDCTIDDILEAAHISPYRGEHTNHVTNGLLLRADIHTLFDRGLIKVDRDYCVTARADIMAAYDLPKTITLPRNQDLHPNKEALDIKWNG